MAKRKDIRIYILSHKDVEYGIWDNDLYTPLEVGGALRNPIYKERDNKGDNISEWNPLYAENTGIYWLWKNRPKNLKYIGVCQYRRRLNFPVDYNFDFKGYDAIIAKPVFTIQTIEQHYSACHNIEDLQRAEKIVKSMYPDYAEDWDKYIKNNSYLFYSQGWIFKAPTFDKYCEWLFSILHAFVEEMGWKDIKDVEEYVSNAMEAGICSKARGLKYQSQIFGFLAERLFTLYVYHNIERVLIVPRKNFEGAR